MKVINKLKLNLLIANNLKRNAYNLSKKYTYIKRAKKILKFKND